MAPPRTLVAQLAVPRPTETFLRAHAEALPGVVGVVRQRRGVPVVDGRPVLGQSLPQRAWRKARRAVTGRPWSHDATRGYLKALRRFRPEVVLAEYGMMGAAMADACERAGVPLVVHFHGYDASMREVLDEFAEPYRRMFAHAAAVIAVSRAMADALERIGCPRSRLVINPYGVDGDTFQQGEPGAAGEQFLAVGRLVDKKAPHLLIRAFAKAAQRRPDARLKVIGDGERMAECRDLVASLGLKHAVELLGGRDHDEVAREMRTARAFVQHSVVAPSGDSEGTPVAVLEAGASGLPVVATRHGGIADVVVEGETGFLVEEGDVDAMADRIAQLAADPPLAQRLGEAARARIASRYTMRQSVDRLARVLEAAACGTPVAAVHRSIEEELHAPAEVVRRDDNAYTGAPR